MSKLESEDLKDMPQRMAILKHLLSIEDDFREIRQKRLI